MEANNSELADFENALDNKVKTVSDFWDYDNFKKKVEEWKLERGRPNCFEGIVADSYCKAILKVSNDVLRKWVENNKWS